MISNIIVNKVLGRCEPVLTDGWGECRTHNCGWAPPAFERGHCWKQLELIEILDRAHAAILLDLRDRLNALPGAGQGSQMGKNFYIRLDDALGILMDSAEGTDVEAT